MDDLELQTHVETLPASEEAIIARVRRSLSLTRVEEITITPDAFVVRRKVPRGMEVFPGVVDVELDPEFLLGKIQLYEVGLHNEHPYIRLENAYRWISEEGMVPTSFVAPRGGYLSAMFGIDSTLDSKAFFGLPVHYSSLDTFQEKILLLAGPTNYVVDISHGAIIDIGV